MKFASFAEALQICLAAADGSPEQEAALAHCLETAPPDLRLMLSQRLGVATAHESPGHEHQSGCSCGCGEPQD